MTEAIITIDGLRYQLQFAGFDMPMTACIAPHPQVSFQPWRLAQHLRVLASCLQVTASGLSLNPQTFSRFILNANQIPNSLHNSYAPLALWWSSGGHTEPVTLGAGVYQLDKVTVKLRAWTCAERLQALHECQKQSEYGTDFDLAAYLKAMLQNCVLNIDSGQSLDELDSAATSGLLSAVIALNIRTADSLKESWLASKTSAQLILRLCRVLGWTPSQIMATSAVEIDLMLALLERAETPKPTDAPSSRLAAQPDAVVIQIEDD